MKIKKGSIAALCVVLASSLFAPVFAHDMDGMGSGGPSQWQGRDGHWKEALGLTDDQIAKLKTVRESREKTIKPFWRKQRDLMIKLKDQLEDKVSDSDVKATLDELRANRETLKSHLKHFGEDENAILTPTQQARMMVMKMHRHGEGMHSQHEWMGMDKDHHDGRDGHGDHDQAQGDESSVQ